MPRTSTIRHAVVVGTTVALVGGALVAPALADPPPHSNASATGQQHAGQDKGKPRKDKPQQDRPRDRGNDKPDRGNGPKADQPAKPKPDKPKPTKPKPTKPRPTKPKPTTPGGASGDPAGNNGTVKIAELGELDGIPNNTPHPGCSFQVEWYGFDEGADVVSTVGFAMQAPTSDVELSVGGDTSVFVGGDAASGAGTATGLDGTETYTLTFAGEPHPQQGYHVRLTVATPRSNGNDTKTKVFWVEPCASASSSSTEDQPARGGDEAEVAGTTGVDSTGTDDVSVLGTQASTDDSVASVDDETEVAGTQADTQADTDESADESADVPTAVDAGENGTTLGEWVRSPLPLAVAGLGLLLAAGALLARRRARA